MLVIYNTVLKVSFEVTSLKDENAIKRVFVLEGMNDTFLSQCQKVKEREK
jgi:hypothetical protein